jgi:colanic acid biosynthesis glycosyl transferase WcaI
MMASRNSRSTILFISQVYVPDPAAVGQHLAGAASELARRGHRVVAFTSARGYYDPSVRYPSRELRDGVEIRRFGVAALAKRSIFARVLAGLLFLGQATVHGVLLRRLDTLVVSTSPPMAAIAALIIGLRPRVRVKYWIMDLNPDQAVALRLAAPTSIAVKAMDWLNRRILRRADDIVVLDRFMAERVSAKWPAVRSKLTVIPPWPLESVSDPVPPEGNAFRHQHGLDGKFVVMYSGNHSPANPLGTLLAAAERLEDDPDLVFLFVGGGVGKREVERSRARGVRSLPYQPLSMLRQSLSAGDVHVVTIGDEMVGIVHPCKVYGAMAVARPILMFGPPENHVADILRQDGIGMQVAHGDVDGAVKAIQELKRKRRSELDAIGCRAQRVIASRLSRETLMGAVCDLIESGRPKSL